MLTSHFIILIFVMIFLSKTLLYIFVVNTLKKSLIINKEGMSIENIRQTWLNKFTNEKCIECERCKHEVLFILSELDDAVRTKDKLAKYCISKLQPEGKKNV